MPDPAIERKLSLLIVLHTLAQKTVLRMHPQLTTLGAHLLGALGHARDSRTQFPSFAHALSKVSDQMRVIFGATRLSELFCGKEELYQDVRKSRDWRLHM
jgi:hypothetical protein